MLPDSFPALSCSSSARSGGPNLTNFDSNSLVARADADGNRISMDRQADAEAGPSATGQAPDVKPPLDEVQAHVSAVESPAASCVSTRSGRSSSSRA